MSTPHVEINAFAAMQRDGTIEPWSYPRRTLRPGDVAYDVLFCGICHTDLHAIGPWGQHYPLVPGHEVIGRVTEVGAAVTRFSPGDVIAVGTIVDSCRQCSPCTTEMESYCESLATAAYDAVDRVDGSITRGGYARSGICDQRFTYHVPDGLDLAGAAPLLCAGITTYSPLRHWNVGPGTRVGIIGIGGLGHVAVKIAHALGAHVVAFTTSAGKAAGAYELGADEVVLSSDRAQIAGQANRLDFVLDTVSTRHDLTPYMTALRLDGTLCSVGLPDAFDVSPFILAVGRRSLASSGSGGTRETNEMLAFCARHNITAEVETLAPGEINAALTRLKANDVRYRFVVDMRPETDQG